MRASGINRAFIQARSLSAGPVMAASIAAGMPSGSEGNGQPAWGACANARSVSAPAKIVNKNNLRSILFFLVNSGDTGDAADTPLLMRDVFTVGRWPSWVL